MSMQEISRIILYLRHKNWSDTEIVDLLLYIASGDKKYKYAEDDQKN